MGRLSWILQSPVQSQESFKAETLSWLFAGEGDVTKEVVSERGDVPGFEAGGRGHESRNTSGF